MDKFTYLNLWWSYNNIHVKEGDEWKAAFITPLGAYEPVVMYIGMTNSPPTFQQMMNDIFNNMYAVVIIYLNDMCIFTTKQIQ